MKKTVIDWSEIDSLVFKLAHSIITNDLKFKNIYGLQRGGLIPAVMLSHQLGIPMTKGDIGSDTLIVDDICDSGKTLDDLVNKYQTLYSHPFNLETAVLHYKPHTSCFSPTLWAKQWDTDDWVVYAWEMESSEPIQDYKLNNFGFIT